MTQLPLFITSASLPALRTSFLVNNDVQTWRTRQIKAQLWPPPQTAHSNVPLSNVTEWRLFVLITPQHPLPSTIPGGLLYLSTFSFFLLFLVLANGKAIAMWDVCPWRIRQHKETFIHIVDVARANCIIFGGYFFDCVILRNQIPASLSFISLFFCDVFPPTRVGFNTCAERKAVCPGRERAGTFISHFSHFLIGLLHLLRSTNCLLGML